MTDRSFKAGMGPESLVHVGEKRSDAVSVRIMNYHPGDLQELHPARTMDCHSYLKMEGITWVDVDGIHDPKVVEEIGQTFDIHMLVLEDIMNSFGRPKVEFFDDYMFIIIKMLEYDEKTGELEMEQFSLIVGDNYLITFQERPGDNFNPIRERIRTAKGKVRGKDARYLAYLLLDVIVDNYIKASQDYSERIDQLENQVMARTNETTLRRILSLRKELLDFKRTIDPLKEAINSIQKELDQDIAKYYRDLYDHLVSESENLAVYREMLSNLLDLHHSSLSYKMNNVMKVLTIITTIFVPLTFIVGVYGMNFDNMPELHWRYGYFDILAVMLALTLGMLYFFKKKRWL